MRRLCTVAVLAFAMQMIVPAPALAWWDFIEELSGPGKFYGWDVDLRLFCLNENIEQLNVDRKAAPQKAADARAAAVKAGLDKEAADRAAAKAAEVNVEVEKVGPTLGAIVSACRVKRGYSRRLAVDLGARFLWATDNARFANGQRIGLTMLEPAVSFNLLNKYLNGDYIDYGFGGGVYWFTSTEFSGFHGAFLEPIRLEFHPPTNLKQHNKWAAAIPVFRIGYLLFPSGFETASFAAAPSVPPRIGRDWVLNGGVFFDLEGLFK